MSAIAYFVIWCSSDILYDARHRLSKGLDFVTRNTTPPNSRNSKSYGPLETVWSRRVPSHPFLKFLDIYYGGTVTFEIV